MKIVLSMLAAAGVLMLGVGTASAASPAYCDGQARAYANQRAGGNAVGGAVTGAIGGAVLGGIFGGGKGVGTGAAIGGVGGAVVGGSTWRRYYDEAYYQCINSGPAYQPQPVAVVPQNWYQQCSMKYQSFQWTGRWAGYYKGYDGYWHPCSLP